MTRSVRALPRGQRDVEACYAHLAKHSPPRAVYVPNEMFMDPHSSSTDFERSDPIVGMLLAGEASTVHEAEEKYLDEHVREVVELAESSLSDDDFRRHPLIVMLLAHGSRGFEDSLL